MLDSELRRLELAAKTGTPMERLAARHRLKTAGGSTEDGIAGDCANFETNFSLILPKADQNA